MTILGFRIFAFAYQNFLPIITVQWSSIILPDILRYNLKVEDEASFSLIASYFFISYFLGIILGCFLWPTLVKFFSKRSCILVSIIIIGIANMLSGRGEKVTFISICRFIAGISLNIHTVGKDFLFEFAEDKHRQFILSIDSCFVLLAHLAGPFIGMQIYYANDRNFEVSCLWISAIFFFGAFIFFIAFFLIPYTPIDHMDDHSSQRNLDDDEQNPLNNIDQNSTAQIEVMSARDVLRECVNNPDIRNTMAVFALSTACTNCDLVLSIIFLQTPWENQGLSISPKVLSQVSLLSYLPAVAILIYSPKICPKKIPYADYIRTFAGIFALSVIITPLFRDILPSKYHADFNILIYINQMVKYCTNSHIVSPFIHYKINKRANKHIRTVINSINFVISTTAVVIIMNLIVPLLSVTLYSHTFVELRPFNKYFTFLAVTLLQASCLILMPSSKHSFNQITGSSI